MLRHCQTRTQTHTHTHTHTHTQVTERLFGRTAAALVETSIAVFCFGSSIAYCKTIRDLLHPLIALYHVESRVPLPPLVAPYVDVEKCSMGLVWLCLLLPLSLIRDINKLRYCSLLGVGSIIFLAAGVVRHAFINVRSGVVQLPWDTLEFWVRSDALDIISSLPIFLFAFTCQINVYAIFDGLARASNPRMNKVTFRAVALCFFIYTSIGLAGFVDFGEHTCGNILRNYTQDFDNGDAIVIAMYIAIAVTITLSFPLVVQPCRAATGTLICTTPECLLYHA